jgi:hypothetical protein
MGLKTRSTSTTYVTVINGKITKKVKQNIPGAVARVNKMNETVYELHFDSLEGYLKNIETKEGDYGKQWIITISDGGDDYQLQLPFSGNYGYGLLRRLPNIDLNKQLEIKTGVFEEKPYLTVYQGGKKVEYYFTKEETHGLPEMKKIKVKGKDTWDDTERLLWLENYVAEEIMPKLKDKHDLSTFPELPTPEIIESNKSNSETDDQLPF